MFLNGPFIPPPPSHFKHSPPGENTTWGEMKETTHHPDDSPLPWLPSRRLTISTTYPHHFDDLPSRRLTITTTSHFDDLPSRRLTISTTYHHDESPFRRLTITTNHHFWRPSITKERLCQCLDMKERLCQCLDMKERQSRLSITTTSHYEGDLPFRWPSITTKHFWSDPSVIILQLLWPVTLCSLVQITSNLLQRHAVWSYRPYQNLKQIDHNLHDHVFDDVICKPSIVPWLRFYPRFQGSAFVEQDIDMHYLSSCLGRASQLVQTIKSKIQKGLFCVKF